MPVLRNQSRMALVPLGTSTGYKRLPGKLCLEDSHYLLLRGPTHRPLEEEMTGAKGVMYLQSSVCQCSDVQSFSQGNVQIRMAPLNVKNLCWRTITPTVITSTIIFVFRLLPPQPPPMSDMWYAGTVEYCPLRSTDHSIRSIGMEY